MPHRGRCRLRKPELQPEESHVAQLLSGTHTGWRCCSGEFAAPRWSPSSSGWHLVLCGSEAWKGTPAPGGGSPWWRCRSTRTPCAPASARGRLSKTRSRTRPSRCSRRTRGGWPQLHAPRYRWSDLEILHLRFSSLMGRRLSSTYRQEDKVFQFNNMYATSIFNVIYRLNDHYLFSAVLHMYIARRMHFIFYKVIQEVFLPRWMEKVIFF